MNPPNMQNPNGNAFSYYSMMRNISQIPACSGSLPFPLHFVPVSSFLLFITLYLGSLLKILENAFFLHSHSQIFLFHLSQLAINSV